jgi:ectoine hydroxylase-related dioxygenase (phytanoyl-CoA dioxygenase family)
LGAHPKPFREIHADNLESSSLKDEMSSQGYLLIRGLLPVDDINRLLGKITQIIYSAGWLLPDHNPMERMVNAGAACGDPDRSFKLTYQQVFNLESFHSLAHHPDLQQVMSMLVGSQILIHPKPISRLIFPNCDRLVIHAHQDHEAIAGDSESFTAWMPLHDCPVEMGPLRVMEASHHYGLQSTDPLTGCVLTEMALGGDWVGGQINAGDVLIFHSLTVHAASPNTSNRLRISVDCRFQDSRRAINPAELVFPGSSKSKSWEATYASWQSDELKYFWKKLPLQFKPSKAELARLAQTVESPEMRSRYARILNLLEPQIPG